METKRPTTEEAEENSSVVKSQSFRGSEMTEAIPQSLSNLRQKLNQKAKLVCYVDDFVVVAKYISKALCGKSACMVRRGGADEVIKSALYST